MTPQAHVCSKCKREVVWSCNSAELCSRCEAAFQAKKADAAMPKPTATVDMENLNRLHAEMQARLVEDVGVWPEYKGDGK